MLRFLKKVFTTMTTFFNLSHVNLLECISMNNQDCKLMQRKL